VLRFDKQPSFELGVIAFEVCAGCHPVEDYLTAGKHMRGYTAADIADLPDVYPGEFTTLVRSLVASDPGEARCLPYVYVCGMGWGRVTCRCAVADIAVAYFVVGTSAPSHDRRRGDSAVNAAAVAVRL
jgi:hypothetical protein